MHTFGHPCKIDEIKEICDKWNISLVEDAAESLGSYYKNQHTGTFGKIAAFSFNGNKTITTGGGGMIITDDEALDAFVWLSQAEGIIPAFESSHAVAYLKKMKNIEGKLIVVNLSGRGDKDMIQAKDLLHFD